MLHPKLYDSIHSAGIFQHIFIHVYTNPFMLFTFHHSHNAAMTCSAAR